MLNSTNVDESSHERKTWTDDFPYHMQLSEFAQRSISPGQNCSINATHNIKNYILNGANGNENLIHEVVLNKNNIIDCKSLVKDYNKPNADVDKMGTPDGLYTHSFLLNNDKYLMVCHAQNGMNVYDIENDKWLLEKSCHILTYGSSVGARMLLLNDEIIVVSSEKYLVFYLVPNVTDRITEPIFLFKYLLKTTKLTYNGHGMCCLQFNYNEKEISNDKAKKTYVGSYKYDKIYNFKILLFGGQYNKKFTASFLTLDISISLPNNFILLKDENFQNEDLDMDETLIVKEELTDMNDIKCVNFDSKNLNEHERHWFGFECVWNIKNEAIVIVIGGNPGFDHGASDEFREIEKRAVYLYNTNTNEMIQKKNVCAVLIYNSVFCVIVFNIFAVY